MEIVIKYILRIPAQLLKLSFENTQKKRLNSKILVDSLVENRNKSLRRRLKLPKFMYMYDASLY